MIGLLIAAFENLTGRAKGPVEVPKGEREEDTKGNDVRANGNVEPGKGEANVGHQRVDSDQ